MIRGTTTKVISVIATLFVVQSKQVYALNPTPVQISHIYLFGQGGRQLGDYITPLIRTAIIGAAIISFLLFIGAGISMIASAGNPQQLEKGKGAATAGVLGMLLVFAAFWIIRIIEVLLGVNVLNSGI